MIGIGEFSRSTGVPIATLRYYDDIGILRPERVDEFSGYRFYAAAQMRQAGLLRVMRAAGIKLEDVGRILDDREEFVKVRDERRREVALQREIEDWALDAAASWIENVDVGAVQQRSRPARQWVAVESVIAPAEDVGRHSEEEREKSVDTLEAAGEQLSRLIARADPLAQILDQWLRFSTDTKKPSIMSAAIGYEVSDLVDLPEEIGGLPLLRGWLPAAEEFFVLCEYGHSEPSAAPGGIRHCPEGFPGGPLPHPLLIALEICAEERGQDGKRREAPPVFQRIRASGAAMTIEYAVILN